MPTAGPVWLMLCCPSGPRKQFASRGFNHLQAERNVKTMAGTTLSIILPLGPGEPAGAELIADLLPLPAGCELIVAGVGQEAQRHSREGVLCLDCPPGRARQLNAGAEAASGDWLCFLHADSRLPPGSRQRLLEATGEDNALRYFDLRFHDGPIAMRLNELGAFVRSRWLGLPFGDQGLCLPRPWFKCLGGFDETLHCGEDHALVWAARRAGLSLKPLRAPILTSARKYAERGWLRTTLLHLRLTSSQARAFGDGRRR